MSEKINRAEEVQVLDTFTTKTPVPPKGQRGDIVMPFIDKKLTAEGTPSGGNFTLEEILEGSDEALETLPTKADKATEKGLFLDIDNPVFRVDGNGVPFPSQQKAVIKAQKKYIDGTLHWDVQGKQIPDGTEQIEVDINEMVSEGIELKNIMTVNTDNWVGDSYYQPLDEFPLVARHKYYARVTSAPISSISGAIDYHIFEISKKGNDSIVYTTLRGRISDDIQTGSTVFNMTETETGVMYSWANRSYALKIKDSVVIDITSLSEAYPQYTDEQLKKILDESLPYIPAQQSKTLGGGCRLENLIAKATSNEWVTEAARLLHLGDYDIIKDHIYIQMMDMKYSNAENVERLLNYVDTKPWGVDIIRNPIKDKVYTTSAMYKSTETKATSMYVITEPESTAPSLSSRRVRTIDMTSSCLDLWLSLNGFSTYEAKANWCNEHIPAFEGTYDLVLAINQELPVVATCGSYSASTRVEVVSNLNSLINMYTHVGKIEMDGKANSDKLITLDQTVTKQGGAITTETNARLDGYTYVRRNIPTSELAKLKEAIASGNPEKFGFREGDYFIVNGYTYVLADYDHWYGAYDYYSVTSKRHWGVLVNTGATHAWNSNGSTNGGYAGSELHAYLVDTVLPKIEADLTPLGLSLISNQRLYSTAMNPSGYNRYGSATGCASSWGWSTEQKIAAPTEIEIYGSTAWSSSGYDTGEGCKPLKACQRFRYNELLQWKYFWLRDIASASYACYASHAGYANYISVTYVIYVVGLIGIY